MNIEYIDCPTPHIILDNVFDEQSLTNIWKELDFLSLSMLNPEETGTAKNDAGQILKQNKGLFLYDTYVNASNSSVICKEMSRIAWRCDIGDNWKHPWMQSMYKKTNWDSIMLSYYDNNCYYLPHVDESVFTMLVWLWKEPKEFTGGDFYFFDHDHKIECKNNSGVIFMSSEKHSVSETLLNKEDYGRYCITVFSGIKNN